MNYRGVDCHISGLDFAAVNEKGITYYSKDKHDTNKGKECLKNCVDRYKEKITS